MTEGIEGLEAGGVKCDNPSCDYKDDTVKPEEWPYYVNKPCPECGENLFTEEDFAKTQMLFEIIRMAQNMPEDAQRAILETMGLDPDDPAMNEMVTIGFDTHNDEISIRIEEDE